MQIFPAYLNWVDPVRSYTRLAIIGGIISLTAAWPGQSFARDIDLPPAKPENAMQDRAESEILRDSEGKEILPPVKTPGEIRLSVPPWAGGGVEQKFSKRFLECQMRARFAQNITLRMAMSRLGDFSIDLYSPHWGMAVGETYRSAVLPDGGPTALVTEPHRVSLLFGTRLGAVRRLLAENWMKVRLPVGVFELYLPAGGQAFRALQDCVKEGTALEEDAKRYEKAIEDRVVKKDPNRHWCNPPKLETLLKPAFRPKISAKDQENARNEEQNLKEDFVGYQSADTLSMRFLLRQAGLNRADILPDNILHAQFPNGEIGWLVDRAFGFATRRPETVLSWKDITAENLNPKAFNCASPLQADLHDAREGRVSKMKRLFVTCADEDPGITFFLSLMQRSHKIFMFLHCAETDFMDEAFQNDEILANMLADGLEGWQAQ